MFDINGYEFIVLVIVAIVVLGPERLPEYAAKLAQAVRRLRVMAEGAKVTLKEQLGPEYQDINWRQYDPRQYDPRRIVKEALAEPLNYVAEPFKELAGDARAIRDEVTGVVGVARDQVSAIGAQPDPSLSVAPAAESMPSTPSGTYWDVDAT